MATRVATRRTVGKFLDVAKLTERLVGADHVGVGEALHNAAVAMENFADPKETLATIRRAVELYAGAYSHSHPETANVRVQEAVILMQIGDDATAAAVLESCGAIIGQEYGAHSEHAAAVAVRLGSAYRRLRRFEEARNQLEQVLASRERAYGADHPLVGEAQQQLALLANAQRDYPRALALHRSSAKIFVAALGPDHPVISASHFGIGQALRGEGKLAEALVAFENARRVGETVAGAQSATVSGPLQMIGTTLFELGRLNQAVAPLERALAINETIECPPDELARNRLTLAEVLARLGDRARSKELADKARVAYEALGDDASASRARKLLGPRS
ncbi:MAG: tetratricopeptide repeat protein [Kofleriaceae bacterium]